MSEGLLLTELCTICHIKPYKYCCPRCSARTCSLPCFQRHKQWASCTGIRDPAAYVKRSDLATPKGIDHDYNYLTSIERQLDSAERDCASRGILLFGEGQNDAKMKGYNPVKGEVSLENAIKRCRVVVDRAPKGMSRQRQNTTYWDKKRKRIVWTIEWVHKNGRRELGTCPENQAIEAAYADLAEPKPRDTMKEVERPQKKHKPNGEVPRPPSLATKPRSEDLLRSPSAAQASERPSVTTSADHSSPADTAKPDPSDPDKLRPLAPEHPTQPSSPPLHFYLLLPSTPTSYRVLIPLSPSDTLSTALTDRLVLEFPTIYALKQPRDRLPTGFMTEEEYLRGIAEKGHINRHVDGLLNVADGWEGGGAGHIGGGGGLDESAVRDVLKKDLVREVDATK
ncbi:MAG: hypothetical protein LQ345_001234 [Seirophora villosa]|nr:MAG: hypothetical protein LQ345_001234 [Seirophora villosa]